MRAFLVMGSVFMNHELSATVTFFFFFFRLCILNLLFIITFGFITVVN